LRIIYLLLLSVNLFAGSFNYNNIYIKSLLTFEDSLSPDKSINQIQISNSNIKYKRPGKSLLLSGILPGLGQAYTGNWLRAMLFLGLDITALSTWRINNNQAEDKKKEYDKYASQHWDFGRWVHDYYKWYEYKENDPEWNAIREVFINRSDSTSGCAQDPSSSQCYVDIWDHSHKVEFIYDGSLVSSNSSEFKEIFQELCGNNNSWDTHCSNEVIDDDSIYVIKDHHFFEGIQKYDMFFAGWDDNDSTIIITKPHGDKNATSPNQKLYRSLWNDYNEIKTLAGNSAKFMLLNRAISMVDALILTKKWNKKHQVKLSLNAYPDIRNRYGIGSLQLVIFLK
jgi:hypothetical protein